MEKTIEVFLESTKYCDCYNESLIARASEIINSAEGKTEAALKIFSYIRDKIPFNSTLKIYRKASTTMKDGTVDYCNKVNLHVAFLRAVGIPSRLRYAQIDKEALKHFIPSFLYNRIPNPIGHTWCECYLDKRWISCEALFDESLYTGLREGNLITSDDIPTIDWDGRTDLILLSKWIIEYRESFTSFDDLLEIELEKVGYPPKIFCYLFNWLAAAGSRRTTNRIRSLVSSTPPL
ncbi:MAG: transglutaminase-like domain-containing protein [Candidatus Thorarchaeota archaeon]